MNTLSLPLAARALLVAAVVALAADGLLALMTGLADVADRAARPPWWVAAHVVERSRWVVVALLLLAIGRRGAQAAPPADSPAVWRLVGGIVIAAPLVWTLATFIVQAGLFTVAGRWDVDGRMFLAAGFYRQAFVDYVPWLLGGATVRAVARHLR
ncbi:MAG: hypothetical protein AB7H93_18795 [Vicinamibacterales bacterium]